MNIFAGVAIDVSTLKVLDSRKVDSNFKLMIENTIQDVANVSSALYGSGKLSVNETRTSEISIVYLDHRSGDFDTDEIPEVSALLTLLGCKETYSLNERVTEAYGSVVHIAITGMGKEYVSIFHKVHIESGALQIQDALV